MPFKFKYIIIKFYSSKQNFRHFSFNFREPFFRTLNFSEVTKTSYI